MLVRRSAPGRSLLRRRARTSEGAFLWNTNSRGTRLQWILFLFFFFFLSSPLRPRLFRFPSFSFLLRRSSEPLTVLHRTPSASASSIHVRRFLYGRARLVSSWLVSTRLDSASLDFWRRLRFRGDRFQWFLFFFSRRKQIAKETDNERVSSNYQWKWDRWIIVVLAAQCRYKLLKTAPQF